MSPVDPPSDTPTSGAADAPDSFALPPPSAIPRSLRTPRDVVTIERLFARDRAGPNGKPRGTIAGMDVVLREGVHAFLGTPEDGTLALVEALSGADRPRKGRVLVDGRSPALNAKLRARIGVLSATPRLPPASSVDASVRLAMQARGETGDRFDSVLDPFGLSPLHGRATRTLSYAEARAVELALALTTPAPKLVVLHEPLIDVATGELSLVRQRLRAIAYAGGCVVVTTASTADARALADRIHVLDRGRLTRMVSGDGAGLTTTDGELVIWVRAAQLSQEGVLGPGVRELGAALAKREEIRGIAWDEPASGAPGSTLRVRGDLDACALAVAEEVTQTGAVVEAMTTSAPGIEDVRAATAQLFRVHFAPPPRPAPAPFLPPPPNKNEMGS